MQLANGVDAIDLAIYLPVHETLVLSDLHMGFEESLNAQGVLVPRTHYKDLVDRLELIFAELKNRRQRVSQVVITGDLKHEFGGIRRQEWKDVSRIVDYLLRRVERLVLIKGNHDVQLGPIATRRGLELVKDVRLGDVLIIHGDQEPNDLKGVTTIIMGHEHPAIGLRSGTRVERFKCYLVGRYKRKTLIVQPSANLLTEGSDVMKEQTLSPLLSKDILSFKAFVLDDKKRELLDFGVIRRLR
ncbi:metallophosphoesterase [Candidatus Woesearchaeota archaeon]|nr:metallophosphoesterase [Candidatus Woesearchaeota archaeon]